MIEYGWFFVSDVELGVVGVAESGVTTAGAVVVVGVFGWAVRVVPHPVSNTIVVITVIKAILFK